MFILLVLSDTLIVSMRIEERSYLLPRNESIYFSSYISTARRPVEQTTILFTSLSFGRTLLSLLNKRSFGETHAVEACRMLSSLNEE